MRRLLLVLVLLCAAPLAGAQQMASAGSDFARAMTYVQGELNKRDAEQKLKDAQTAGEIARLKEQLSTALKSVAADAKTDPNAQKALTAFAEGKGGQGVDVLLADAAADKQQAVGKYKRAGAIAFAVDTRKALTAYEEALKLAPGDLDATTYVANLYFRLGDLTKAAAGYQRLADVGIARKDKAIEANGYIGLGVVAWTRGDLTAAEDHQKRALALAIELGRKEGQAISLGNLGANAQARGDLAAAEGYYKRALALNTLGSKGVQAGILNNLGAIAQTRGNLAGAEDYYKRALALNTTLGSKEGQAVSLGNLGTIAQRRGDLAAAEDYYKRGLVLDNDLGRKVGQAAKLNNLGNIAYDRNDRTGACEFWRKALALYEGMGAGGAQSAGNTRSNIGHFCPR